ncbi:MAG TPA: hypothetical protein VIB39_01355 [Candidatus Angelobacter sp.]
MKPLWVSAALFVLFSISTARAQACFGVAGAINLTAPVTGAPFTADYTHVFEPLNSDGSRNRQESRGKVFRDSEGRARCDMENLKTGKTRYVIVTDPVANVTIRINVEQQTATVTHHPRSAPIGPSKPPASQDGTKNPETKAPVNASLKIVHSEADLGSREIEGLMARGKHSSNTCDQTSSTDEWYSPDLKFTLLYVSDYSDASSSSHMKDQLTNIHLGDPDPSVFRVPEGFTVKNLYCRGQVCNFDSE